MVITPTNIRPVTIEIIVQLSGRGLSQNDFENYCHKVSQSGISKVLRSFGRVIPYNWRHCNSLWRHMVQVPIFFKVASPVLRRLHYNNVQWPQRHLNSAASRQFVQQFAQADIKRNLKATHHAPFEKGIHRWPVDSPHKGPVISVIILTYNTSHELCTMFALWFALWWTVLWYELSSFYTYKITSFVLGITPSHKSHNAPENIPQCTIL